MALTDRDLSVRHFADLSIRADGDGRTVSGVAVPFDTVTKVRDWEGTYDEVFRNGSFAKTIEERGDRVKLLTQHQRHLLPIGRATLLREDPTGLYGEFRVAKVERGDEVLQLVNDGALDAFSIGFRPVRTEWNDDKDFAERIEVRLDEVSIVAFPAYDDALITDVRATDQAGATPDPAAQPGTGPDPQRLLAFKVKVATIISPKENHHGSE